MARRAILKGCWPWRVVKAWRSMVSAANLRNNQPSTYLGGKIEPIHIYMLEKEFHGLRTNLMRRKRCALERPRLCTSESRASMCIIDHVPKVFVGLWREIEPEAVNWLRYLSSYASAALLRPRSTVIYGTWVIEMYTELSSLTTVKNRGTSNEANIVRRHMVGNVKFN